MGDRYREPQSRQRPHEAALEPLKSVEGTVVVGYGPLDVVDGMAANNSGIMVLKSSGVVARNHILMCRPNHGAGQFKMAAILAYQDGKGFDFPEFGVRPDAAPTPQQLDAMAEKFVGQPQSPADAELKRRLYKAASAYSDKAEKYVPLAVRGSSRDMEVCVRKDEKTSIEWVLEAIDVLEKDMKIPRNKVRVVADSAEDLEGAIQRFQADGELWRLYPPTRTKELQAEYISDSVISTREGLRLYYAAGSGERHLTCEEFGRFADLFDLGQISSEQLLRQMGRIVSMMKEPNRMGRPNLSTFETDYSKLKPSDFEDALKAMTQAPDPESMGRTLNGLRERFRDATAPDYLRDDADNDEWRRKMYSTILGFTRGVNPRETRWGLSKEFVGEVEWKPGGRVVRDAAAAGGWKVEADPLAGESATALIRYFESQCRAGGKSLQNINVGKVIESRSKREKVNEPGNREVYVVEWRVDGEERNHMSFVRRQKWNENHFLRGMEFSFNGKKTFYDRRKLAEMLEEGSAKRDSAGVYVDEGVRRVYGSHPSEAQARKLSQEYTAFVLERNRLSMSIDPGHPLVKAIEYSKAGRYAVFFERSYVDGVSADKMPYEKLSNPEFCRRFASLMGGEAARNMVLGRMNPFTQKHLYADGDEIIQLDRQVDDPGAMPKGVIRCDETCVMGDVSRDFVEYLPTYASWLSGLLARAKKQGVAGGDLATVRDSYLLGFRDEMVRLKKTVDDGGVIKNMFGNNPLTDGEREYGWPSCKYLVPIAIDRLLKSDPDELSRRLKADKTIEEALQN